MMPYSPISLQAALKKGGAARAAPTRVRNLRHIAWIALLALLPLPAGVLSLLATASSTAAGQRCRNDDEEQQH